MANPTEVLQRVDGQVSNLHEWLQQERIERSREQERLRTLKPMRFTPPQIAAAAAQLIVPGIVDEGYVADLRVIAAKLSAADSLAAFVGENANGFPLGQPVASAITGLNLAVILIPKSSGLLSGGETIFLQTGGTGNIVSVRISGWQVAGPEVGKLF